MRCVALSRIILLAFFLAARQAVRAFSPEDAASPALFPDLRLNLTDVFPGPDLVEEPYAEYMRL